ncbi:MAG: HAD-IA family hydrolase [Pseudomonadota bacterium]
MSRHPARLVFDLDGTLIDSARDIQAMANATLATVGAAPLTMDETKSFIGKGIGVFTANMRAARGIPDTEHARLLADITARYNDAVTLTEPYPGVPETLAHLAETHRLGICTNKLLSPCLAVLKHLDLDHHFQSIWGGDNPLARKPDPAPLLATFAELGEGPRVYIGDSEVDADTAQRAGVPFILFTPGYRHTPVEDIPHDAHFDDFMTLPSLVGTLLARQSERN